MKLALVVGIPTLMTSELPWPPCGEMVTVPVVTAPPGFFLVAGVRAGLSATLKPAPFGVTRMPGSWALTSVGVEPLLTLTWKLENAVTELGPLRVTCWRSIGAAVLVSSCQGKHAPFQLVFWLKRVG